MTAAAVVGSGPNGLTAAVLLARAGLRVTVFEAADTIGGGTRSSELTMPGVLHDHCSAIHPLGLGSPAFRGLELDVDWAHPEIALAHPLDRGRARVLHRDPAAMAPAWRRLFGPIAARFDDLAAEILRPILHVPRHPLLLTRFGLPALAPATLVARALGEDAPLFAGMAAHAFRPLTSPTTASIGLVLGASGHALGWPVARGGSRAITDALAADLLAHGGRLETGRRITSLADLDADVVLLDLAPDVALGVCGDRLPPRVARAYRRFRRGPAAFKLDLAVAGGVPWTDDTCRRAGTVHVGGDLAEIVAAERDVARGRMPERPFVLVAQQYLADPARSAGDVHPVWTYAHVPHGYTGDASGAILAQLERFAPGLRERIVGTAVRTPSDIARDNANFAGGDIGTGANDPIQVLFRPRIAANPYATGIPGVYLCSAATPPGGGVHGMCGANAAASALRDLG